ncbi:hypothetical protein ZIOFF_029696 [Zingiber officinale]|uniref:DUF4408 domain-containing protein n=1 Tax=Zingiber officinale TaxID=94328 RepID=A0A8J5GX32_ZINOF|nr:hypothetical protein ZIOFF_029696 [Zingiber officinale]
MDSVKVEKLEAMERYRNGADRFLRVLVQFMLRALLLGLFMSSPNWLPCFFSSAKFFIAKAIAMAAGPKFVFMVSNVIIVVLVGESRLSKKPAERVEIYEEYLMKSQPAQSLAMAEVKEKEGFDDEAKAEALIEEKEEEVSEVEEEEEVEGEGSLPAEELNRRVEDFIAKVNLQRQLEAKMLICYVLELCCNPGAFGSVVV